MRHGIRKKIVALLLCIGVCFTETSCAKRKEIVSRFGMDIDQLNPLVMTAVDCSSGEKVFSRDPSIISEVTALFENMKPSPAQNMSEWKGIQFTVSTMYGNFTFGECSGNYLRVQNTNYILEKDYSNTIRIIYKKLKSETDNTAVVSLETLSAVKPDMTYRELIDNFGSTLVTAAVGKKKALLYQCCGRPFYILFEKETDKVGMTGDQLSEQIWDNYNLGQSLTQPTELTGGYLSIYEKAFDSIINMQKSGEADTEPFKQIVLNSKLLVHLDETERTQLVAYLADKYAVLVEDSTNMAQYMFHNFQSDAQISGTLVLWVEQYSYIGSKKINFEVAGKKQGQMTLTKEIQGDLVGNEWRVKADG